MAEKTQYSERERNYFRRIEDQKILVDSYVMDLQKKAVVIGKRLIHDLDDLSGNFAHLKSSYDSLEKEKIDFETVYKDNLHTPFVKAKFERVNIELRDIQKEMDHAIDCAVLLHWDQRMMDQLDQIGEVRKPSFPKLIVEPPPSPKPRINFYKQISKAEFSTCDKGSGDGMLSSPSGIAVNSSYIYVCDTGNDRIQIYDNSYASFVLSIQHKKLSHPISISVDSEYAFVTQTQPERVIKFDVSGIYHTHYNHVKHPTGICIHDHEVYICSSESKLILILDYELKPVQRNGILCKGYLTCPRDVKVSTNDELIVLDWGEYLFMFFNLSGILLKKWSADPKLNIRVPAFFDIDTRSNVILVTDESSNNIVLFNFEGRWVHTIGDVQTLSKPSGIAILRNGKGVSIIVMNQRKNDQLQIWH